MVRVALAFGLLLTAVFSGCFAEETTTSETSATTAAVTGTNSTQEENATAGAPPVASIVVLVEGEPAVADANGTVTAAVGANLTFDGSASVGTNLSYTWDFGDGSPALEGPNATVAHAYSTAGAFAVVLVATAEDGQSANASVSIVVQTSGPPAGTFLREDPQAFGSASGGQYVIQNCFALFSKEWVLVDVEANGTASHVSTLTVTIAAMTTTNGASSGGTTKIWFRDATGKALKENTASGTAAKTLTIEGPVPAGTYKVEAQLCAATAAVNVNSSAVTGKATYVAT